MKDTNGSVAVLGTPDVQPVTQVQATADHAVALGKIRESVLSAKKKLVKAQKEYSEFIAIGGNVDKEDEVEVYRKSVEDAVNAWLDALPEGRADIDNLPSNTRAKGGANRQSVVVECFGRVDLNLGKVMSPQDAAKLNRSAWAT